MEEIQAENERLKERINDLEYELNIMTDFAEFYYSNELGGYFKFEHDDWKRDLAICKKLGYPLLCAYEDIFKLNDEEKTDYYLNIYNKNFKVEYENLFHYDGTLRTKHQPFAVYLINHDKYPDTKIQNKPFKNLQNLILQNLINTIQEEKVEFCKHVQDIFNSVMMDSKILYWDANIFSIIQKYLNLPYHWKESENDHGTE
jgi:hypothetical protein